ncbi:MAG: 2-hydroxyacid dehydrogenase [Opitutaceae bacterium]|nr:2-hydroxyacid dehydrogenase [Opitutaceae bacterium]
MSFTIFYFNPKATAETRAAVQAALPGGWNLLTPSSPGDQSRELAACDFILVADHPITAANLDAAPRLRMIQHQGVGHDNIDLAACQARGIPVAITPEGTSTGVAEHTLLLILALYKKLLVAAGAARQGRWLQWELRAASHELSGKVLGLVGFGRIGQEVARRAAAFNARILYTDPLATAPSDLLAERVATLGQLLERADIVSLHLPLTTQTRHLINARSLAQMRRSALLINTSRGGLVDEAALLEALDSGRLAGAGLDVLAQEPPPGNHPLLQRDDVLITPHISAGTREAFATKMRHAFANMLRHTRGEPLHHCVTALAEAKTLT